MTDQKRVLFFVHDGSGLGHLRRIARIAEVIQGPCASLVVTGMRQAASIVPENCEFIHLPNWDSFSESKSKYWSRYPWLNIDKQEAKYLRNELLLSVISAFKPHAIIVDYLPFGRNNELEEILTTSNAKKYLILRGLIDTSDFDILYGEASYKLGKVFDSILVTADAKIVDVGKEYFFCETTASKIKYMGYIIPEPVPREAVRAKRGLSPDKTWVVCSGGGGMRAEEYLLHCLNVASLMPEFEFDIVFGPLSKLKKNFSNGLPANCRVHYHHLDLASLHSSCDLAITSGGYNSIMEAMSGGASIIVFPTQSGTDDEQMNNANRLALYYPIKLLSELNHLFHEINSFKALNSSPRPVFNLNGQGLKNIQDFILNSLH